MALNGRVEKLEGVQSQIENRGSNRRIINLYAPFYENDGPTVKPEDMPAIEDKERWTPAPAPGHPGTMTPQGLMVVHYVKSSKGRGAAGEPAPAP